MQPSSPDNPVAVIRKVGWEHGGDRVTALSNGGATARALAVAGLGQWRFNADTGRIDASGVALGLHGIPSRGPLAVEAFWEAVHPPDVVRIRARLRRLAAGGGAVECEYRLRDPGRRMGIEAWCDGSPARVTGVVWDAGPRYRRESALRLAIRRLKRSDGRRTAELAAASVKLEQHASALRMALDSSGAVACRLDLRSGKMEWDAAGLRLIGFGDGEEITLERVLAERVHPAHRGLVVEELAKIAADEGPTQWDQEFLIIHPGRGERWINCRGRIVRNGSGDPVVIEGLVLDVTDRKRQEEMDKEWHLTLEQRVSERTRELQESEARFRMLSEASVEGVVISRDGVVLDVSSRAAEMMGYEPGEMIGRSVRDFVPPGERERVIGKMRAGDEEPYSSVLLHRSGSVLPITCRGRAMPHDGRSARVSVLCDQTETHAMVCELQARQAELERTAGLALASGVSTTIIQQLGDPLEKLEVLVANIGEWMGGCATCFTKWGEAMEDIAGDLCRMREIMVHLRSLEIPAGKAREAVRVDDLVAELIPLMDRDACEKSVELRARPQPGVFAVAADAVQIKQVVINLVRNAIEACEDQASGARRVTVETRGIPGRGVEIVVRDTGSGLAEEVAGRLFTPFLTTKPQGIGIGLRLCQTIVRAHRGTIVGYSLPDGEGACFTVFLPLETEDGE